MRVVGIVVPLIYGAVVCAQSGIPRLPLTGQTIRSFISDRWTAIDTAFGDLNNDDLLDVALVLQCRDTILGDTTGMGPVFVPAPPRTLAILFGTSDGLRLALQNDRFILRSGEGGWFDPFEGTEIRDGMLLLHFYGGSAWRFSHNYMFRYGNEGFMLIGAETAYYHASSGEGEARSIDFLSRRMKVTSGIITEEEEDNARTTWKDMPPGQLRTFDTFVRPFTWRIDDDLTL